MTGSTALKSGPLATLPMIPKPSPMAPTWNQYCVPLTRPVTVQLEALPT
jgi:hypothetical protein